MVVGSAQARAVGRNINRFDESRLQQVQNSLCCVRFENIPAEATILFRWQVEGFSLGLHIRVKMFLDQLYYGCFSAPMLFRMAIGLPSNEEGSHTEYDIGWFSLHK